LISEEYDLNL